MRNDPRALLEELYRRRRGYGPPAELMPADPKRREANRRYRVLLDEVISICERHKQRMRELDGQVAARAALSITKNQRTLH